MDKVSSMETNYKKLTAKYDNEKDQYENKIRQLNAKIESLQSDLDNEMEKNIILSSEYDDFKQQQREEIENLKDIISDLKIQASQTKANNENNKDETDHSKSANGNEDHALSSMFNDSLLLNNNQRKSYSFGNRNSNDNQNDVSQSQNENDNENNDESMKQDNENSNNKNEDVVDNLSSSMIQNSNNKRQFKYSPQIVDSVGYVRRRKKICSGWLSLKTPSTSNDGSVNTSEGLELDEEQRQRDEEQGMELEDEEEVDDDDEEVVNEEEDDDKEDDDEEMADKVKDIVVENDHLEVEETVMKSFVTPEKHHLRKPKEYFTPDYKRVVTKSENTPQRFQTKSPGLSEIDTSFSTPSKNNNIVTPMSIHSHSSAPFSAFSIPSPSKKQQNPQFAVYMHILTDPYINEEIEFLKVFNEEDDDGNAECYIKFFDTNKGVWNKYEYDDCFDIHSNQLLYNQIPIYIQHLCNGEDVNLLTFGFPHSEKNTLLFGTKYSWTGESSIGLSNSKLQNTITNHSIPFDINFLSSLLSFRMDNSSINAPIRLTAIQICNEDFYDLITNKKLRLRYSDKGVLLPNLKCLTIKKIEEYQKFLKTVNSNYNAHVGAKAASYYLFTVYVPFMYNYDENEPDEKFLYSKFTIINCPTQDTSNPRVLRSLTSVKEVLLAMKKKAKVIPYRSNKVTMLLKYFFTENSKINIMTFINNYDIALYDDMKSLVGFVNTLYMPLVSYLTFATPPKTKSSPSKNNDKDESVNDGDVGGNSNNKVDRKSGSGIKPKYDSDSKIPGRMSKKKDDKTKQSNINDDIFNENENENVEGEEKKESHIPAPKSKKKGNYIPSWFVTPPKNPVRKQKVG